MFLGNAATCTLAQEEKFNYQIKSLHQGRYRTTLTDPKCLKYTETKTVVIKLQILDQSKMKCDLVNECESCGLTSCSTVFQSYDDGEM